MTFAENINRICKLQGTTLTAFIKSIGISTSKVTAINNGSLPKESEMVLFAQKLGCSVMDFFADEEDIQSEPLTHDEDEEDVIRIFRTLSRKEKHAFMSKAYEYEKNRCSEEYDNMNPLF